MTRIEKIMFAILGILAAVVIALLLFGCSVPGLDEDAGEDAGADAATDTGTDAAPDGGTGFCFYTCQPVDDPCTGTVHVNLLCNEQGWICCETD